MTDDEIIDLYCKVADGTEWAIGGLQDALPFARLIEAAVKERCAVAAWKHHMDTARKKGVSPEVSGDYCSAAAIRAMKGGK